MHEWSWYGSRLEEHWLLLAMPFMVLVAFVMVANWPKITVSIIRRCNLPWYPLAVKTAMSIVNDPLAWTVEGCYLVHPTIGRIWTETESHMITVTTRHGVWYPTIIEREIIREAVEWHRRENVRQRLELTVDRVS